MTENKQHQQFLLTWEEQFQKTNQEFRNELAVIAGTKKLLEDPDLNTDQAKELTQLDDTIQVLSELLEKYEALFTSMQQKKSMVNIPELIQRVASTFTTTALARHIRFSFDNQLPKGHRMEHYYCDEQEFQFTILGLLKHAFETIPAVTYVSITLSLDTDDEERTVLHIQRDGAMISPRDLDDLRAGSLSRILFDRHIGVLNAKHFADSIHSTMEIHSDTEKTFIQMYL